MIGLEAFTAGLGAMAVAVGRSLDPQTLQVYGGVVRPALEPEEWDRVVQSVLHDPGVERLPTPAQLLERAATLERGPVEARAGKAYDEIVSMFERGNGSGWRVIEELHGRAVADAFVAAGGHRAFAWCEPASEPFRRRDFIAAFRDSLRADVRNALPAADQKLLR